MSTVRRTTTKIKQSVEISTDLGPLPLSKIPETIWARRKSNGAYLKINLADFGSVVVEDPRTGKKVRKDLTFPERHFELAPDYDPEFERPAPVVKEVIRISGYTEDDLKDFTVPELRKLPEWGLIDSDRRFRNREEMIEAVIQAREDHRAATKPKRKPRKRESLDSPPGETPGAVGA